nr:hypothetical protein B11C_100024 [Bartonella sp. 1-1C]
MRANYKLKRLFVRQLLALNEEIVIEGQQASYLIHVLRMKEGAEILLFNGKDGEWLAKLLFIKKKLWWLVLYVKRGCSQYIRIFFIALLLLSICVWIM